MKMKFSFLISYLVLLFVFAISGNAQNTIFTRTCAGQNPTVKQSKMEMTRDGDINMVPCATRTVLVNGVPLVGLGTVQSVGMVLPSIFNVSGAPVTSSGNLTAVLNSQTANTFFSAPSGAAGAPVFRAIVPADVPSLDVAKITTGTFSTSFIPSLDASKINTGTFATSQIPALDAAKVTTGTFAASRISALDAAQVTTGTFATGRIPALDAAQVTTGTFATGRIPALDASAITTGTFAAARLGSGTANSTTFLRGDGTFSVPQVAWGGITGTLSNQTDLQNALNLKANAASPVFSGTVTTSTGTLDINAAVTGRKPVVSAASGGDRVLPTSESNSFVAIGNYNNVVIPTPVTGLHYTLACQGVSVTCLVKLPSGITVYGLSGTATNISGSASFYSMPQGSLFNFTATSTTTAWIYGFSNGTPTFTP
jgi:hypothetical protein